MEFIITAPNLEPISSDSNEEFYIEKSGCEGVYDSKPDLREYLLGLSNFEGVNTIIFKISGDDCKITTFSYAADRSELPSYEFEIEIIGLEGIIYEIL